MIRFLVMLVRVGGKAIVRYNRHDGGAMAGYIAYTSLLAVFPFLIFASALAGLTIGAEDTERIIQNLFRLAPEHIALTLEPVAREVLSQTSGGLLTISAIGAIWVASSGFEAFRVAFDRAYQTVDPRPVWVTRGLAILFVFVATAVFLVLGLIIVAGPLFLYYARKHLALEVPFGVDTLRYSIAAVILSAFLLALHRVLPARHLKTGELWPGVVVTGAILLASASLFSVYLRFAPNYTVTYGALAGVILTLLFFYVAGAAIIFGAEINAALSEERAIRREAANGLSAVKDAEADVG